MSRHYERRYPPTPFPPHSDATRRYRDAWDLGWQHFVTLGERALDHHAGLTGPSQVGYRDGLLARAKYEERAAYTDPSLLRREREQADEERRRWSQAEQPY